MNNREFHIETSIGWRVLSNRNDGGRVIYDAGYWTSSYTDKEDAVRHSEKLDGQAFEVTSRFLYKGKQMVQFLGQTWELIM